MEDKSVAKAVQAELDRAESFMESRIAYERALAYDYYYGREFGNEVDGRSRVISADVAQAVDSAVPDIVEAFVGGDEAVEFSPRNADDVQSAEQATVGCNYVFFTQNNGFGLTHDFIKDGLLQKTGVFKWRWDTSVTMTEKRYKALDDGAFQLLGQDPDLEIIEHTEYPDPSAQLPMGSAARSPGLYPVGPQGPQGAPMMPMQGMQQPMQGPMMGGMMQGGMEGPEPPQEPGEPPEQAMLHDVTVRQKKEAGKIKIIVPPPEEIKISPDSMTLDVMDMPFIAHTPLLTRSDLIQMGYDPKVIDSLPKGDDDPADQERVARATRNDANVRLEDKDQNEDGYRYNECYMRLDEDGDGIAELRKICMVGNEILMDEPTDHIPMAIWTPKVMPHEVIGISLADDVMDLQLLKSTVWRQTMDNMYLTNAPRLFVKGDVNMDDVLTVKPGGVIRGEQGSELTPIAVPFTAAASFQMLEYADQEKDARVGFSSMGPGLDPDAINKTATYVRENAQRTNARAKLIARNAAEYGFKPLFKGIIYLLSKHQQEALMVRLNNKFVPIDPEAWNKEYDMTCNVGLGVGSKEQQLMHLQGIGMDIQAIAQSPYAQLLLSPKKVYNYFEKKAQLAGFKDATEFVNDPVGPDGKELPMPPPPPNPLIQAEQIKGQTAMQMTQAKAQMEMQMSQVKAQADAQIEQNRAQADQQVQQMKIQTQAQLELERTRQQLMLEDVKHSREQQNAYAIAQLNNETKIVVAQITAKQQAEQASAMADSEAAKDLGA